jgi:hypothetical protein
VAEKSDAGYAWPVTLWTEWWTLQLGGLFS